ncbi:MAG: response regulator transcription factor [Candidatus Scalinduaceae bacterium]
MPKILIADDEPGMRMLLEQTFEELEEKGVKLFIASDGIEAFECIKKEKPELVILDAMMPGMDGYELCDAIKNKLGIKDIYVLMLTAMGQEIDKQKGRDVGVDVYMTKPFDVDEIVEKIVDVLGLDT